MLDSARTPTGGSLWPAFALLAGLVALQLLPGLELVDFHREEARRVLPAREMLASGDFVLPTIWGHAYLSKPPGFFWVLALAFELAGGVSELAARLPSVLATLATSLSICWVGARLFNLRAGLFGGALFVLAIETLAKGRLAEIEPTLSLFVFLAVALWWLGTTGSWFYSVLAGLALAGALLCKGPVALIYFVGPPLALAIAGRSPRLVLSPRFLLPLFLGLGLAGLWVLALFERIGSQEALAHWGSQMSGQGGKTLVDYGHERIEYLLGTPFAFAPASFLVLLALRTPVWRELYREPRTAFAVWAAAAGWLFFLFFPGTNVRYAYPGLAFIALLAGRLLEAGLERGLESVYARRLTRLAGALAWLAILAAVASLIGFFTPLGEIHVDGFGLALGALLLVLAARVLREPDPARAVRLAVFLLPLVFGQLYRSQAGAATALRHSRKPLAAELDTALPAGAPLHVGIWRDFNTLLYVEHEVRYTPDWKQLEGEAWLLLPPGQFADLEADPGQVAWSYEELYRREFWDGERILLHVLPRI